MPEPTGTQYAGFWARLLAFLADSAIVLLVSLALLVGVDMALGPEAHMPVVVAVSLLGLLYWPLMQASGLQATLGKAIVGLKVARLDGRRISILRSVWRELAKVISAAVLMLGYLMAALMPRKQGLHDLLAATYVVREGPSRIIPALAVAAAGFALPVVVGPMAASPAVMATLSGIAQQMAAQQDLVKQIPGPAQDLMKQITASARDLMKQIAGPAQEPMKQAPRPTAPAPKATPKPPVQTAKAPAPQQKASAPKPETMVLAQPAPVPPEPAKAAVAAESPRPAAAAEPAKAAAEPVKAKAAAAKPKPPGAQPVARTAKPAPVRTSEMKIPSGLRYNDLMTAVLHRDTESVHQLLKLGKWVDKPDSRGVTPLMVAAELGDVRTAEALLRGGANASRALPVAEERRHGEMLKLLKRYTKR